VDAGLIGGDDPMAAMSRSRREIRHLSRLLQRVSSDLGREGPDPKTLAKILRPLHGLDAIPRLHFAQENEIYHSVLGSGINRDAALRHNREIQFN
jgi:hypothetical protein